MFFRVIVDKIKQNFLLNKFKKYIINSDFLRELNMICTQEYSFFMSDTEQLNKRFDDISKYISKKYVIDEFANILNLYYRWNKIYKDDYFIKLEPRKLLTAWLIFYCPKLILDEINSNEKIYVYQYSSKLVSMFNDLLNNKNIDMVTFNKIIIHYTDNLIIFLEKDLLHVPKDENQLWLIPHPFLFKNTPDIFWPNTGDMPSCNAGLIYHKIFRL
jgi:hypothetical protein